MRNTKAGVNVVGILDRFTTPTAILEAVESAGDRLAREVAHDAELTGANDTIAHLEEAIADLEQMLDEPGWRQLSVWGRQQFSRQGIGRAAELCRVMAVANPLIRRGLALRTGYVWGGGVEIAAHAKGGSDGQQDVNAVVQDFLDDPDVVRLLADTPAQETNERTLGTDGNLLVALFTAPRTGRVRPRLIAMDEVQQVIKNPEDRSEPWFYQRLTVTASGSPVVTYHPDVDYQPRVRATVFRDGMIGDQPVPAGEVMWDAPILHMKVNALPDWDFGIGDAYASIAWARAYKEFLEDWAKLVKALSRFAWRVTADRKGPAQRAAQRINVHEQNAAAQGAGVGATAAMSGASLEAIPKTGATIDSESGKPLAALIAAGLDVPVTMLLGDPGVTGARATAETLDKPTENMAGLRRGAWAAFYRRLLAYVVEASVKAPGGALKGVVSRDEWGRLVVTLDGDTPATIEVEWPDLSDTPVNVLMQAIGEADAIDKLPPLLIARMVLAAFNVSDADEWLAQVTDDAGDFKPPKSAVGQAAADAFRGGNDPAADF